MLDMIEVFCLGTAAFGILTAIELMERYYSFRFPEKKEKPRPKLKVINGGKQ